MSTSLADFVDPFWGVDGAGNCLPGPYLPFSLVRLGPDVVPPHSTSGYSSTAPILRFSHTHVSGTGGMGRYGNVGLMPFLPDAEPEPQAREQEQARPGRYSVRLLPSGIQVDLTCTPHVGVHRWRFPGQAGAALLDAGAIITTGYLGPELDPNGFPTDLVHVRLEVFGETAVGGEVVLRGGWGHGSPYPIAFYAEFSRPFKATRETDARIRLDFQSADVEARVGISFASLDRARQSVLEEAAAEFEALQSAAFEAWERALRVLQVEGGSDRDRTLLATSLYRLLCMPTDLGVGREFTGWPSSRRHFSDFYCLWDSCRNANSWLAWLLPQTHAEMVNCLLEVAERRGWSPDAWIAGDSAFLQGGSSLDVLLGEAAAKKLPGIDLSWAWSVVRPQLDRVSPDPYRLGRYPQDRELPYLPADVPQCVSRHLEYRYQEFCLSQVASALGNEQESRRLRARANTLWELWRDDLKSFAPRHADGTWVDEFDPEVCREDCWNDPYFYEGSGRQWSWNALHDLDGLVQRMGGAEAFVHLLETFLSDVPTGATHIPGMSRKARYHPKETMLHVPYLFHEVGQPDRSSAQVRSILERFYHLRRDGLPDNEDMGCQSAFVIGALLGIAPVMGQNRYWLTAPAFPKITVQPVQGPEWSLSAPGADEGNGVLPRMICNGRELNARELRHEDLAGKIELHVTR